MVLSLAQLQEINAILNGWRLSTAQNTNELLEEAQPEKVVIKVNTKPTIKPIPFDIIPNDGFITIQMEPLLNLNKLIYPNF